MTAEWRRSAAAGLCSSGNLGSGGPQTAAAACAAEPGSGAVSECTLWGEGNSNDFN